MQFKDQIGRILNLNHAPERIISLVPSITELLFDLDLDDQIFGVTKFCVHPKEKVKQKVPVGGTKNARIRDIIAFKPDLVVAAKEENLKEHIDLIAKEIPCYVADVFDLNSARQMIDQLGVICNRSIKAKYLNDIIAKASQVKKPKIRNKRVLYLIWKEPYMAAGGDTFINYMLGWAGFNNIIQSKDRYPNLSLEEIISLQPDHILLSSEPYPFKEKHIDELKKVLPETNIILVNGESYSWYGSRLIYAFEDIRKDLIKCNNL